MSRPERRFRIVSEERFSEKPKGIVYTEKAVRDSLEKQYTMLRVIPTDRLVEFLRGKGFDIEEVGPEDS